MTKESSSFYSIFRQLLFFFDPETAHHLVTGITKTKPLRSICRSLYRRQYLTLENEVFGVKFRNPVGVAGGFDKNADLVQMLESLGFGFSEVGSVSNVSSRGNPRPRLFRLVNDAALINRMGLNNVGAAEVAKRLESLQETIPVGVNIVKTHDPEIVEDKAIEDIKSCYQTLIRRGNFHVLNVSCPNTREGKTFEEPEALTALLSAIRQLRMDLNCVIPMLVKLSPDTSEDKFEQAISICESFDVAGYVLVNTSTSRDGLSESPRRLADIGRGGLSGKPLFKRACARVKKAHVLLDGRKPIIGVGGVSSAENAYEMIRAGASLVEVYTGLVYQGPKLAKNICLGLEELLKRDGAKTISEVIGVDN